MADYVKPTLLKTWERGQYCQDTGIFIPNILDVRFSCNHVDVSCLGRNISRDWNRVVCVWCPSVLNLRQAWWPVEWAGIAGVMDISRNVTQEAFLKSAFQFHIYIMLHMQSIIKKTVCTKFITSFVLSWWVVCRAFLAIASSVSFQSNLFETTPSLCSTRPPIPYSVPFHYFCFNSWKCRFWAWNPKTSTA